jgi:hypothetical protein
MSRHNPGSVTDHRTGLPALVLGTLVVSCGGGAVESFLSEYSQAVCHRIHECCASGDAPSPLKDTDEASCFAAYADFRHEIQSAMSYHLVRFDSAVGSQCLARLRTSACQEVFDGMYGVQRVCGNAFPGTGRLGDPCDDDFVCESNDCVGQSCVTRPCSTQAGCLATEYCSSGTRCLPLLAPGDPCTDSDSCGNGGACLEKKCAPRRQDGETCRSPRECVGTCTIRGSIQAAGTCRPGLCQGR